jgi:hypothetical protein
VSSVDDYTNVPWQEQDNPFLTNFPVVHIVRCVRSVSDGEITVPDSKTKRLLSRVGNNRVYPKLPVQEELLALNGALSVLGGTHQLKNH